MSAYIWAVWCFISFLSKLFVHRHSKSKIKVACNTWYIFIEKALASLAKQGRGIAKNMSNFRRVCLSEGWLVVAWTPWTPTGRLSLHWKCHFINDKCKSGLGGANNNTDDSGPTLHKLFSPVAGKMPIWMKIKLREPTQWILHDICWLWDPMAKTTWVTVLLSSVCRQGRINPHGGPKARSGWGPLGTLVWGPPPPRPTRKIKLKKKN